MPCKVPQHFVKWMVFVFVCALLMTIPAVFIYQEKSRDSAFGRSVDRREVGFWNRRGLTRARDNVQDCVAG